MPDTFAGAVKGWADKTTEQQSAVLHEAFRLLDSAVMDAIPVVSGNLRNSRTVTTQARPAIEWRTKKFRDPSDTINNAIAGIEVGTPAWYGFRAPYAFKVERKYGFARLAAQRWPQLLAEAARTAGGGT